MIIEVLNIGEEFGSRYSIYINRKSDSLKIKSFSFYGENAKNFIEKFLKKFGKLVDYSISSVLFIFEIEDEIGKKFVRILDLGSWKVFKELSENIEDFEKKYEELLPKLVLKEL